MDSSQSIADSRDTVASSCRRQAESSTEAEEEVVDKFAHVHIHKKRRTESIGIGSRTTKLHACTTTSLAAIAPNAQTTYKVAPSSIAQGLSPFWQPGPCRSPSPTPLVSSTPRSKDSTMNAPEAYREPGEQEPDSLPLTHGWLFKGIKTNVCNLPLRGIEHSNKDISSRRRIEVLAEYTWIQITKGQRMANVLFPAVYVPGQPRVWQGITTPSDPLDASSESPAIIDEHFQRQKSFPYEPTFKVLHTLQQLATPTSPTNINFRHVDMVSDAATLATLFDFLADPDPRKRAPFRLELSNVHNTLFLTTATHRGRGHTEKDGQGPIPAWVAHALTTLGTGGHSTGPLFLSGNHFRVVRYRLGALVLIVRTKVDFTLENRAPLPRNEDPPFRGCQYERYHVTDEAGKEQILGFQTLVKNGEGRGTQPGAAGVTSVRFAGWDCASTLARKMPLLWFGRIPFVLDGVVSQKFEVMETKLFCARESYGVWEEQHKTSLQLMAGTLEQLRCTTHNSGGDCIVIADPGQRCLRIHRPAVNRSPVPEALALAVWGPDGNPAETVYATSTESDDDSELSQLSGTPSGFSDWKVEAEKMPSLGAAISRGECIDTRRAVEDWLDHGESGYESSNENAEGRGKEPISKKNIRACARNPVMQYMLPNGSIRRRPAGSFRRDILDGAVDYIRIDEEEYESIEKNEAVVTDDTGDSEEEMSVQAMEDEDEDENNEEDIMSGDSRSAAVSSVAMSSSPSLQGATMADGNEDDDTVCIVEDQPIPSIELDELRLGSSSQTGS
ncbi:hypothetical protein N0V82_006919 [Gnomoniopsis sp. IMI 355080]|nr:hypothetical protein N0V82_006919 [Gnomoniopsis sp. IMI 355080]